MPRHRGDAASQSNIRQLLIDELAERIAGRPEFRTLGDGVVKDPRHQRLRDLRDGKAVVVGSPRSIREFLPPGSGGRQWLLTEADELQEYKPVVGRP